MIHGGVTISGYDGFWFGFIRNHVRGTVSLSDNVLVDPDGNEYVTNTIHGSLNCSGNSPAPQVGDSEAIAERRDRRQDRSVHGTSDATLRGGRGLRANEPSPLESHSNAGFGEPGGVKRRIRDSNPCRRRERAVS